MALNITDAISNFVNLSTPVKTVKSTGRQRRSLSLKFSSDHKNHAVDRGTIMETEG